MIIDSHVHIGSCNVFNTNVSAENLIGSMKNNKIDICIVQPFPGAMPSSSEVHNDIYKLSKEYPQKIFGVASVNPHLPKKDVSYEIERCIKELGFVGIKCHTIGHAVNPLSEDGDFLFKLANQLNVPIIIHTGNGISFACPSLNITKAKQYPELKIILAHSGMIIFSAEALVAANECENIYLETSWSTAEDIDFFIKNIGSERIMMGSDVFNNSFYNQAIEITKYRIINISDKDRNNCLFNTAKHVFNLDI